MAEDHHVDAQEGGQRLLTGKDCLVGVFLIVIAGAALYLTFQEVVPERHVEVDTRLESGTHLTFVFIAPTSAADPAFREAIRRAKPVLRNFAEEMGYYFSTVGISDAWDPRDGWELLREFGTFDEMIVGRNWLNTGVKKYISNLSAEPAVPQVIIVAQYIDVSSTPLAYGPLDVIGRFVGMDVVKQWASRGYPVERRPIEEPGPTSSRQE